MATDLLAHPDVSGPALSGRGLTRRLGPLDGVGVLGVACWAWGLSRIDLGHMGDSGLITVLPGVSLLGLALVAVAFVLQIVRDPADRWRPGLYVVALVVMLDGLPCIIESAGDVPTGYIHVGFIDYILHHGQVLDNYDARFSWPGMFAWSALATVAGGASTAMVYLRWTPLALDLLYLLPLRLLLRRCCPNPRVAWVGAAVFVLGNWVQQDYFSPQGLAYLGYLSVLAVLLACTRPTNPRVELVATGPEDPVGRAGRLAGSVGGLLADGAGVVRASVAAVVDRRPGPIFELGSRQARAGVTLALVAVMAGVVTSHELTPYALLLELAVLLVCGRRVSRTLVVILVVLSLGYLSFGAENFWAGHFSVIFGGIGHVGGSVSSGLVARTKVSPGHELVVEGRLVYTAALLGAGVLGAWVCRARGGDWRLIGALAAAPWLLVGLQSYGGEVFIRSLFFSLPFLAMLAAEPVVWILERPRLPAVSTVTSLTVAALTLGASLALIVTRYGNEPFYLTTPSEIAAVRWVDRTAAPGAVLAVLNQNLPWRFEDIDRYTFVSYQARCPGVPGLGCLRQVDADYVIMTQSEAEDARLEGGFTAADLRRFEGQVLPEAGYRRVLETADAQVYAKDGDAAVAPAGSPS